MGGIKAVPFKKMTYKTELLCKIFDQLLINQYYSICTLTLSRWNSIDKSTGHSIWLYLYDVMRCFCWHSLDILRDNGFRGLHGDSRAIGDSHLTRLLSKASRLKRLLTLYIVHRSSAETFLKILMIKSSGRQSKFVSSIPPLSLSLRIPLSSEWKHSGSAWNCKC